MLAVSGNKSNTKPANRPMLDSIPEEMKTARRWLLHKAKRPLQPNGRPASSTNSATWSTLAVAEAALAKHPERFDGLGFALGDGIAGVDEDNAIDETGHAKPWAREVLEQFPGCYAEVSPSGNGLHIFALGSVPQGKKAKIGDGAVEVYGEGRYFTVTGKRWADNPVALAPAQPALDALFARLSGKGSTDRERCREALGKLPEAVSGDGGHDNCYRAAREIYRHGIDGDAARELLEEYNDRCSPPFSDSELKHKLESARDGALRDRDFGSKATKVEGASGFDLKSMAVPDFLDREYNQRFLVENVVVAGEHLIIGGPKKSLKTSIALDLAISLSTGSPFLGYFAVPEPSPVLIISGESGGPTLQKSIRRIAGAKGVEIDRNMRLSLRLPQLGDPSHLEAIREEIVRHNIALAMIDPAYLCTLNASTASQAGNVFAMGSVLQGFGKIGIDTGCTMALVHHNSKGANRRGVYDKPELADLSQSGFAEWMRQWVLLGPRKKFDQGRHELHAIVGGSAGHFGDWAISVDEGDPDDPLTDRRWVVDVCKSDELEERERAEQTIAAQQTRDTNKRRILVFVGGQDEPVSRNRIKEESYSNGKQVKEFVSELVDEGKLEVLEGQGRNGCDLYTIAESDREPEILPISL